MPTEGGKKLWTLKISSVLAHFFAPKCLNSSAVEPDFIMQLIHIKLFHLIVLKSYFILYSVRILLKSILLYCGYSTWWRNLMWSNFKIKSGSGARKFRHIGAKKWAMAPAIFKCRQLPPTLCRQRLLLQPPFHEFLQTRVEQNACLHDFSDTFSPSAQPTNLSHKN